MQSYSQHNIDLFLLDLFKEKENGCFFNNKNYPVSKVEVKDTSGAGDSFFAALITMYLLNHNIEDAIHFANSIASEVVKHKGVT